MTRVSHSFNLRCRVLRWPAVYFASIVHLAWLLILRYQLSASFDQSSIPYQTLVKGSDRVRHWRGLERARWYMRFTVAFSATHSRGYAKNCKITVFVPHRVTDGYSCQLMLVKSDILQQFRWVKWMNNIIKMALDLSTKSAKFDQSAFWPLNHFLLDPDQVVFTV